MGATSLMSDTCEIQRKVQTQSATSGGPVITWSTQVASTPCMVQMDSGSQTIRAGAETAVTTATIFVTYNTDVQVADRIIWQTRTFAVVSPPIDEAGRKSHYKLTCVEMKGGTTR